MVILIDPGAYRNANVGISNDKGGKIPPRRKTKVSQAMSISLGLAGLSLMRMAEGEWHSLLS